MIRTVKIIDEANKRLGFRIINESDFNPAKHIVFNALPASPPLAPAPPPLAPAPGDALAEIRGDPDWRKAKGRGITKLREIAAAVSGRTPANGEEAIAMIEAALAADSPLPPAPLPPPPPS